ncbi:MAG TPA: TonB-dependent copper receptor [Gammaproteobacteria bacterium]|nr:TonB-dependent copper receptor [Gammaproteobacteria bacterium]
MSRRAVLPGLISLCLFASAQAEHVPVIYVEGELPDQIGEVIEPQQEIAAPVDTGAWLRSLPGVSGTRLGGHGIDPVIRGQGETRVNVLLDGAYVHGGCPNRMDPATSYAPLTSYDKITLIRGNQTVRYGGGGSGGTLLLERDTQPFADGDGPRLRADAGYGSNGDRREATLDGALGNELGYARVITGLSKANNYEDGDGNDVRSAYDERGANLLLGYTPNAQTLLELGVEAVRGEDILYAGSMDAPKSDHDAVRLKFSQQAEEATRGRVSAELYHSDVEHLMDNYSLRPLSMMMMPMSVPSDSTTDGGRLQYETGGARNWLVGIDTQRNDREATRYSDIAQTMVNSYMWPGVSLDQWGVFVEHGIPLAERQHLRAGLRYDRIDAEADRANADPMGMPMSPNQLYMLYYSATAQDVSENNVGGFLRYTHEIESSPITWNATLSRSVRTADATERFMAANGMTPDARWVGNPTLDPEQHHQFELGAQAESAGWDLNGAVYVDEVSDFILRDRAHSTNPMLGNATIYRNVDARLYGTELGAARTWAQVWQSSATIAYVYGENRSDDRALAQIAPLELGLELRYVQSAWDLGGRLRVVDNQTRVDDDPSIGSGLDAGETSGFAVLDLSGRYALNKQVDVKLGVDNVFDRTYAEHLNRANDFDPVQVQINEPGRNIWLRLSAAL